jgi:hypothetical protein
MNASDSETFYHLNVFNSTVICTVSKRISIEEFYLIIDHIREVAETEDAEKMLIDFSKINFSDLTILERHRVGLKVAETWGSRKAAAVVQQKYINKHAENVANNRGGNVLATDDYEKACQWLWN